MQRTCNGEARSRNQCSSGKAKGIKYSECVSVALVIQHAKCIHRITLLPVAPRIYHIYPHYLINGTILLGWGGY